jgi:hypothetical protein
MASTATPETEDERALVGEGWAIDPFEPSGAEELYRRVAEAEPRSVPREELEGRTDLTARELYELGCTLAPLGLRGASGMVVWRLAAVAGAVLCALGAALALAAIIQGFGLSDDRATIRPDGAVATAVLFALAVWAGRGLLVRAVGALRRIAAERRRTRPTARAPGDDPHARAAVTVLRGAGWLRVQLLWLRADVLDPACAEVRVLAERRVEDDDAGRAEDAIVELSEVALRARAAHALRVRAGWAALGLRRGADARRRAARRVPAVTDWRNAKATTREDPRTPVPPAWCPDPLADEDAAAELARRLCLAPVQRWSAESLSPLVVARPVPVRADPPAWPTAAERTRRRPLRAPRALRRAAGFVLVIAIIALAGAAGAADRGGDPTIARIVGYAALSAAAALLALRVAIARRARGAPLRRAVRAAAARPPRGLECGLPGMAGTIALLDGRRDDGRTIALAHVRAAPDDGREGELEVRTLAWRELRPEEAGDPAQALQDMWTVADGARARTAGVQRSTRALARLATGLGRATATSDARPLRREPLAWLAASTLAVLVAASVKHTLAGDWLEHGALSRTISYAWVLAAGLLLLTVARRVNDPAAR